MANSPQHAFSIYFGNEAFSEQVIHVRGFSGSGLTFLTLVAACFSLFNVETRSLAVALAMAHDLKLQRVFTHARHRSAVAPKR